MIWHMEHHPQRRFKCPTCHALPGEPCLELNEREKSLSGTNMRNGVSHWDRVRPPHAFDAFWSQWDLLPGLFAPLRFMKAIGMTRRYYRELRG